MEQGLSLPHMRVLWALPQEQLSSVPGTSLPSHFKLRSAQSTPNFKVMASPLVHVVISHCGLGAAQEALYFGKPLVCIPLLGDQPDVAARVADAGAGVALDKSRLTALDIQRAVKDVRSNASYTKQARYLGRTLRRAVRARGRVAAVWVCG